MGTHGHFSLALLPKGKGVSNATFRVVSKLYKYQLVNYIFMYNA